MKQRVTGIISFICATGWLVFIVFMLFKDPILEHDTEAMITVLLFFLSLISTILYIVWTRFGNNKPSEIKTIEYEIQVLKKKLKKRN